MIILQKPKYLHDYLFKTCNIIQNVRIVNQICRESCNLISKNEIQYSIGKIEQVSVGKAPFVFFQRASLSFKKAPFIS